MKLSVVAPCYNEEGNIRPLVDRTLAAFQQKGIDGEIILVNDASTDKTGEQADRAGSENDRVQVVHHEVNQGIVGGWVSGVNAARGDLVVTIDADLQYRPEDVPVMLERYEQGGWDVVQGARTQQPERSFLRKLLTAGLSFMLNIAFGTSMPDNKSGFVLAPVAIWKRILDTRHGFKHFQHFIGIAIVALQLRITQVPIVFDPRNAGQSYITSPIGFALKALKDFPLAFWRFRVRRRSLRSS